MLTQSYSETALSGLTPYTGTFGRAEAAHLLRRCVIGPTLQEIDEAVARGMEATLDLLTRNLGPGPEPLNADYDEDPNVPIGASWVDKPFSDTKDFRQYRGRSLKGWFMQRLNQAPLHIRERMTLFWVNYFGMDNSAEFNSVYRNIRLFQQQELGNVKQIVKAMTVAPEMLIFLNGRLNNVSAPDENYARELLELYTVQKGKPGDVNYTEEDIREIARVLTGWRVANRFSTTNTPIYSYFDERRHDKGTKRLSAYFGNAVIEDAGENEYKRLINIIFEHPEAPRAFVRDLYIYFVDHRITDEIERDLIRPLADQLRDNNFGIRPVVRALLASSHFYTEAVRGTMVKNPYEYVSGITRALGGYAHHRAGLSVDYEIARRHYSYGSTMDMDYLELPTVSGWKAYYQAPTFYRNWISGSTLQQRQKWVELVTGRGLRVDRNWYELDYLAYVDALPNPYDVNAVIADTVAAFLAVPLHPDQIAALKEVILLELPDFEWPVQYGQYRRNPNDIDSSRPVLNRVKGFFAALFSLAEFQLQ